MKKPKSKLVYWREDLGYQTTDPHKAKIWIARKWRVTRVTVYSARKLREWERQREGEIRREERLRVAAWLFAEGYRAAASEIRRWL